MAEYDRLVTAERSAANTLAIAQATASSNASHLAHEAMEAHKQKANAKQHIMDTIQSSESALASLNGVHVQTR